MVLWKGQKEERKGENEGGWEEGSEGGEEEDRKEGKQCINSGLVPYLKFQILLPFLKGWQNEWFMCNFKIEVSPF